MSRLVVHCLTAMFFSYIAVVGLLYFGPIGLFPLAWWVWSLQLERRNG
jgi:hypothetical protein